MAGAIRRQLLHVHLLCHRIRPYAKLVLMPRKRLALAAILVFAAIVLAYSNHFENGFHFDDFHTVQKQPLYPQPAQRQAIFHRPRKRSACSPPTALTARW